MLRGKHNMVTQNTRLYCINMIGAISSRGEFFYTVNQGKTNSYTFLLFMIKLVEHLNQIDKNWKQNSLIVLDNAQYHRGSVTIEYFENKDIPVLYLGPYHFKMAPIEMFFSYLKSYNLNPLRTKISKA